MEPKSDAQSVCSPVLPDADWRSPQIDQIAMALNKVQAKLLPALKTEENPFFKSSYADLTSCWNAIRSLLAENGLAVAQTPQWKDGHSVLSTILLHTSGQYIRGELPLNPVKNDPQSLGSAVTYMRRYGLSAIVGICTEDDDGNAATGGNNQSSTQGKPTQGDTGGKPISEAQVKRLLAISIKAGWKKEDLITFLQAKMKPAISSLDQIPWTKYEDICKWVETHPYQK